MLGLKNPGLCGLWSFRLMLVVTIFSPLSSLDLVRAQTTLSAGDIAFTFVDEGGEKFAFVLLTDVDSGTEIKFDSNSGLGGDTHTWTASGAQSAGTVISEDWDQVKSEAIYAYQGSAACANVLAELSMKGWQSDPYEACNPSGAQSIEFSDKQKVVYDGTRSGDATSLLTALNSTSNWIHSGSSNTTTFTVSGGGGSPCDDSGSPSSLSAGDIAFTAFNSDGNDAIGFVLLTDVNAGTSFRISDNDWNGSSISENNYITWTTGCAVDAGTVVFIQDVANTGVSGSGATINVGSVTETGTFKLDGANEEIWAYQGSAPNLTMLAAISNDDGRLVLSNSGLHPGHVVYPTNDADGFEYTGDRTCVDACLINDITNWANYSNTGANVNGDVTVMSIPDDSETLLHETFANDNAFTGENQFFISNVHTDYFGIWDPGGATDDFGSSQSAGMQPVGLPTQFVYAEANGNILMARDLGHNGGSNPSELVWTINTTGYESCAKIELVMANHAVANGRSVAVSFSTDGSDYSAGTGFDFTGISFWGNHAYNFTSAHEAPVTLPIASTVYVKLTINSPGANEYLGIDDFKIKGKQGCLTDVDGDGVCEDSGDDLCTDTSACNYDGGLYTNAACITVSGCDFCSAGAAVSDSDTDGDGTCDVDDGCVNDPNKTAPGLCGCGVVDVDVDSDGLCDTSDNCTDTSANNYSDHAASECQFTLYSEDFEDFPDNYGLGENGVSSGGYPNDVDQDWTLSGNTSSVDNWWVEELNGNKLFEGKETEAEVVWTSPLVNVAGRSGLNFSADLFEGGDPGNLEAADYMRVFVKYDGGSETLLVEHIDDFTSAPLSTSLTEASTVQFVIRVKNDQNGENHRFDNLLLTGSASCITGDVTAPTIVSTAGGAIELDASGVATLTASSAYVTASDDCSETGELSYLVSDATDGTFEATLELTCSDVGSKDVYFRVKDEAGNESASAGPATITVQDVTPPNLSMLSGHSVMLDGSGNATILPSHVGVLGNPADACTVNGSISVEIKRSSGTYSSSVAVTCADVGVASFSVVVRATDSAGNAFESPAIPVTVTETVAGSCGCTDKTACNYSASATLDDSSCVFPGYQCASPSSGLGYTWTVNGGGGDPCLCTAQSFDVLYSEEFDDENFHYNITGAELCTAAGGSISVNGSNWSWDCTNIAGHDSYGGFYLYDEPEGSGYAFEAYKARDIRWVSKSIDITGYSTYFFDSRIMETADLDASDGWTAFAKVDGGTEAQIASVTDDVGTSKTVFSSSEQSVSGSALVIEVELDAEGEDAMYLDDVAVSAWGKTGCTDPNAASGYDVAAQVEDGSCVYQFATAYSRYDGGFSDKIWAGTPCGGNCGEAPYLDAKSIAALSQNSATTFDFVVSSGTTVTADGVTPSASTLEDLFVRNLTIEQGGSLVIPSGKRIRVMGDFLDHDGASVSGEGRLCVDGAFSFPSPGEGVPSSFGIQDLQLPPTATVNVPSGQNLSVQGDLYFGETPPSIVSGMVTLNGSTAQVISGAGAVFDELVVNNASGVTASDAVGINGRLCFGESASLSMGANNLTFASVPNSGVGEEEKTGVMDMLPSSEALLFTTGAVKVERYFAPDTDGVTLSGYSLFASPIDGVTVGDLDNIPGFYLAGWPGTTWPNSFATVLFWDEAASSFVEPASNATLLNQYGGAWIMVAGSQTPTMVTSGTLNSHVTGDSKTFALTRSNNAETEDQYEGWNLVYNPFQARLDWNLVIADANNAELIEDQFAIYDTQSKQFVRYSDINAEPQFSTAARCIEPGQAFWVRVKDNAPSGINSGTLTIKPEFINNDGPEAEFVRSTEADVSTVILETENAFGATKTLIRFREGASEGEFVAGDLSRLASSSVRSGEMAVVADGQCFVAKSLPMEAESELYVRSRANVASTMRVVSVSGNPSVCAHIVDSETGEILLLQEGEEMAFTLTEHDAPEGRFTLYSSPFALTTGVSPDCPDDEEGMVLVELGDVVADLTLVNYATLDVEATLTQVTGDVEFQVVPGEYGVIVNAQSGASKCRGGHRHALVFPGEEPELLGLAPQLSACNEGTVGVAFELYGGGQFQTSIWQDNALVYEVDLPAGEHLIDGLDPGQYTLKVIHPCLDVVEWVDLDDPGLPQITPIYAPYTELGWDGEALLEATCLGCFQEEGFGHHWIVNGVAVNANGDLDLAVDSLGAYEVVLVAYGPDCEVHVPFQILVGKNRRAAPGSVRWLGISDGELSAVFEEEWAHARLRWYDSAGRLLLEQQQAGLMGGVSIQVPSFTGWLTLEVVDGTGRKVRWTGLN